MTKIGFIGLGSMGKNMILHLLEEQISVIAYNRTISVAKDFSEKVTHEFFSAPQNSATFTPCDSIVDFINKIPSPRVIFLMIKAGNPIDQIITELVHAGISKGDIIIDGGNSNFEDSKRRFDQLFKLGIQFIDCGTSGGLEGGRFGASLMLGGDELTVKALKTVWDALSKKSKIAPQSFSGGRWDYIGSSGSGHFVKMVHNGIEYAMTQALGEGMEIIKKSPYNISLLTVAQNYSHGSVIRGWLTDLLVRALNKDPSLNSYSGKIGGGQTGKWAQETAEKLGINIPVIESSIKARNDSSQTPAFSGKVVSALRFEYGGHVEVNSEGGQQ